MSDSNDYLPIDVEELKKSIDPEVYYTRELGSPEQRKNDQLIYLCRFHNDKNNPNFYVTLHGKDRGCYYCFACKAKGDIITLHIHLYGVTFREALVDLAGTDAPHLLIKKSQPAKPQIKTTTLLPIPLSEIPAILEKAKEFFKTSSIFKISNDFKLVDIYLHFTNDPGALVLHIRYENSNDKSKKPKKATRWASYTNGLFNLHYKKLDYFLKGGKLHPFTGHSLTNPSPPPIEAGDTVIGVEGQKQVVALGRIGIKAITTGSTSSLDTVDLSHLPSDLDFRMWPDNDLQGRRFGNQFIQRLKDRHHAI